MTPSRSDTVIVLHRDWRFDGRSYQAGDRFDWVHVQAMTPRLLKQLMDRHAPPLAVLSPKTWDTAMASRSAGGPVPRGWTRAQLIELGLMTAEEADAKFGPTSVAPAPPAARPEGEYEPPEGAEAYRNYWIVPVKTAGGPPRFDILNAKGEKVNKGSIAGKPGTQAKIDEHIAAIEANTPPAEPPTWEGFPHDYAEWSDEQRAEFDAWFDALPEGEPQVEHPGVKAAMAARVDAEAS